MEFIEYSKCSTCKNAKKFLNENNIKYIDREIKDNNLTKEEIKNIINKYNIDINKLFNTSGLIYRSLDLKNKLKDLKINEKIELLTNNPMLVKRPLLINDKFILIGFKINEWKEKVL